VARGRRRTHHVLVVVRPQRCRAQRARRAHQAAVAHRARLRGDEGRASIRSLRGKELAGLPPSHGTVRGSVRVPRNRACSAFPLRLLPSSVPVAYPKASARGGPPMRPERHNPASIATQRVVHAHALVTTLPVCPGPRRRALFHRVRRHRAFIVSVAALHRCVPEYAWQSRARSGELPTCHYSARSRGRV